MKDPYSELQASAVAQVVMLKVKELLQAVQKGVQSMSTAALTAARTSLDTKQSTQQTPLIILCGDLNTTPDSSTCQVSL